MVAGLLALAGIHVFLGRHTASVPKWMSALESAEPKRALSLGFLLILLMPTDIVAVISTVHWLHDNHDNLLHAWPLVAASTLLMALPILAYLLLGRRAREAMPGIRDWLTTNAWVVNLVVIVYFIYQLVKCPRLLRRDEQVRDSEDARLVRGQRRRPARVDRAERLGIGVDDADQHLADDAAADRPEPVAVVERRRPP